MKILKHISAINVQEHWRFAKKPIDSSSAVLLVKSKDVLWSNKRIESEIKLKINPGVKMIHTKPIKGALLINCDEP